MDLGIQGRLALVTGSTRGIGRAIAGALAREGARVAVCARTESDVVRTAGELGDDASGLVCDLAVEGAGRELVERVSSRMGVPDVVVANAGGGRSEPGPTPGESAWSSMFALNFWSAVGVVEAALPGMTARGSGSVVLIGSIAGMESIGAPMPYECAKAGVAAYASSLSRRVASGGVRVNCVAPGNVLFEGGRWEEIRREDPERVESMLEREVPMRRFGRVEEIADVVAFLASDRASFVTGASLAVDGGQTRGLS